MSEKENIIKYYRKKRLTILAKYCILKQAFLAWYNTTNTFTNHLCDMSDKSTLDLAHITCFKYYYLYLLLQY